MSTSLGYGGQAYEPGGQVQIDSAEHVNGSILSAALTCKTQIDNTHRFNRENDNEDTAEGLEKLQAQLETISKDATLDPATRELAQLTLESYGQVDVALESLDDVLSAMSDHVASGFGKIKQTVLAALGSLAAALPSLEDKWRKLDRRLYDEAKDPVGVVSASGLVSRLHRQGVMPSGLESYLCEYATHVETIATTFDRAAQEAVSHNADVLASIEFNQLAHFQHTFANAASQWQDPRQHLSESLLDFIVPGGEPFFISLTARYKGEVEAIRHFDTYATKHVPPRGRWGFSLRKIQYEATLPALGLAEMRALCKHFIAVTESIKLESNRHSEALAHANVKTAFFIQRKLEATSDVKSVMREPYRYINRAYAMSLELGEQFKWDALHRFVQVSDALIKYMDRSLRSSDTSMD
jgi:hypothetical protein